MKAVHSLLFGFGIAVAGLMLPVESPCPPPLPAEDEPVAAPTTGQDPPLVLQPTSGAAIESPGPANPDFTVRLIPRSQFPLARPLTDRTRRTGPFRPDLLPVETKESTGPATHVPWDQLRMEVWGTVSMPDQGSPLDESRYTTAATRFLDLGKIGLETDVIDRGGRFFLPHASLEMETFGGWRIAAGDQSPSLNVSGFTGVIARGLGVERERPIGRVAAIGKAGLLVGNMAVSYGNQEKGTFPRSVQAGYLRIGQSPRRHLQGTVYRLSDRGPEEASSGPGIRTGGGIGLSAATSIRQFDVLGHLHGTDLGLYDRDEGRGISLDVSGRGKVRRFSLGGQIQASGGTPFDVGHLGALQTTPGMTQKADVAFPAADRWTFSVWGARWKNPVIVRSRGGLTELQRISAGGRQAGGRAQWKARTTGTALSLSEEYRWRELDLRAQETASTALSVSQALRRGLSASLRWNHIHYSDRSANDYLTGDLSVRLGRGIAVSFQQRTLWQEPLGPRLESILDLSGIRLLAGRLSVSGQFAVTHDRTESHEFDQSQAQGRILADLDLSETIRLTTRYHLSHSPFGEVHDFHVAVSHSSNSARYGPPTRVSPILYERQVLRGRVFEDLNGDSRWQEGEPGIPGVEIIIDASAGEPLVSDVEGLCRGVVLPGLHVLRVAPTSVPIEYLLRDVGPLEVEVPHDRSADFEFCFVRRVGSIEGRVVDGNTGEGLAGVRVLLGERDFTYTDEAGMFRFPALPAGEYDLRLDPGTLPFGYRPAHETLRAQVGPTSSSLEDCTFRASRPVLRQRF